MKCPSCNHQFNYRQAKEVTHQGETLSLVELSKITGIPYSTLQNRYRRGDRDAELARPVDSKYSYPRKRVDPWESGELGRSMEHAQVATDDAC